MEDNVMQTDQIAQTILIQLGGRKFVAMTGSRHFLALENGSSTRLYRVQHNRAARRAPEGK